MKQSPKSAVMDMTPGSVKMTGPEGITTPYAYEIGGVHFIAKFSQKDAISLIVNPKSGENHQIHFSGQLENGSSFNLIDTINMVGNEK